jgi:hypothetical protein
MATAKLPRKNIGRNAVAGRAVKVAPAAKVAVARPDRVVKVEAKARLRAVDVLVVAKGKAVPAGKVRVRGVLADNKAAPADLLQVAVREGLAQVLLVVNPVVPPQRARPGQLVPSWRNKLLFHHPEPGAASAMALLPRHSFLIHRSAVTSSHSL